MSVQEWDVAMTPRKKGGPVQVVIPAPIARSLGERGYNRARVRLTGEGILYIPYRRDGVAESLRSRKVDLPDWGSS
ncbi:hypothetical protein Gocc_2932 [Gaiella occulta]|uniref:Uncharacterized protein n=1 Tax=Gaiella occulta TaxID=1002870 RepID=A0A7M2YT49_9ACTN|nr:hypothetical protein [Gaiella occulta]RDI73332.1 hypothetical protein Gocc_2932 [Gaiella occulta]